MAGAAFVHEALVYDSDEEFVAALTPFLSEGLRRGEAAVAAVTTGNIDLLRAGLGDDAGQVTFIDRDTWYQRPASTIAGWIGLLADAQARGHQSIRIVGEVAFGAGERHDTWIRYESALNDVFATVPARVVCPYDSRRLPAAVLAGARHTHPVVAGGACDHGDRYQQPDRLLRTLAEPLPPVTGEPAATVDLRAPTSLRLARHAAKGAAQTLRWDPERIDELLLIVTEIAGNSLVHGRGDQRLHLWIDEPAITCEVLDRGDGPADPLVGYRPPADAQGNRGLWLANQLSDWLAVDHDDGTTRVRFRFSG